MTNTKNTKRALLSSVMALFLCFAMLLGTTYAWFTDSVTSSGNIIKSGTLEIEFDKWNGTEWVDASAEPIFNYDKWEPGYTQVVNLRVVNVGTLALKWQAAITTEDELSELADVINVYVRSDDRSDTVRDYIEAVTDRADFDTLAEEGQFKKFTLRDFIDNLTVMTQGTLEPAQESYLGIVLQMDTAAGNDYQGLDLGGEFDLTILATQLSSESDSFGNDYDLYATYDALKKEGNVYSLVSDVTIANDVLYQSTVATEAVTINGNGHTVTGEVSSIDEFSWTGNIPDLSNIFSSEGKTGAKVTVNDITFTGTMSAIMAGNYVNSSSNWFNTEFNNVNIVDAEVISFSAGISPALCIYGNMTMNDCVVTGTKLSELDTDPMWPAYDVAVVNYSNTVINNSKIGSLYMWNQAKVTVAEGSEVETIVVRGNMNASKYGLVIGSGATVETLDLSAISNAARVNVTIEDGAAVGKIILPQTEAFEGKVAVVKDGKLQIADSTATDNDGFNTAITNGETDIVLAAGEYTMPTTSGDVTITGTKDTIISGNNATAENVTFNGVTIQSTGASYTGIKHSDTIVYNNVTIVGNMYLYAENVTFNNCTFDLSSTNDYIWVYGATNVAFNNCTFNTMGKAILVFQDGSNVDQTVKVEGCTFNASAPAYNWDKTIHIAAVSIDGSQGGTYNVILNNNTVDSDFNGLWQDKTAAGNITVTVDGTTALSPEN